MKQLQVMLLTLMLSSLSTVLGSEKESDAKKNAAEVTQAGTAPKVDLRARAILNKLVDMPINVELYEYDSQGQLKMTKYKLRVIRKVK